ncbi:MAG: hypothetical protein Q7U54_08400 [Bacteroidales bacterium]|nr:hypothetical protein [Bacteroidales bacterium]
MRNLKIALFTLFLGFGQLSLYSQTYVPVVEFMDKSAHISSAGAMPGWDIGFRRKFDSDFKYMVNQLQSDLANVKMEGESGGKTNFEVQISITLMHDCNPCTGENAVSEESFFASLTIINASGKRLILDKFFTDNTHLIINGEPNVQETIDRTWSQFQLTFLKDEQLRDIIKRITAISDASLIFKAKNPSDKLPMKADGKKKGALKITNLKTEKADYPVGENANNPLTEFELSCKNGFLIDKNGQEVKKLTFIGSDFVENRNNFEFDYVVYNCDELCDKYDNFTLTLKSQNGVSVNKEIRTLKEEFACYGYSLSLDYTETTPVYGTTHITATWNCVKIDFGKPGEMPDTLAMEALMTGNAINTSGDPLTPPFVIPLETETGQIHVSAPIMNNLPAPYTFSCTGGNYSDFSGSFTIEFGEDYLTNPPDLILVKTSTPAEALCGGVVKQGVYLDWQFDIWATLPELGYHQIFQVAATSCPELANHPNNVDSQVPENVIPLMKAGKAFSFIKTNSLGATYTITGTPQ